MAAYVHATQQWCINPVWAAHLQPFRSLKGKIFQGGSGPEVPGVRHPQHERFLHSTNSEGGPVLMAAGSEASRTMYPVSISQCAQCKPHHPPVGQMPAVQPPAGRHEVELAA